MWSELICRRKGRKGTQDCQERVQRPGLRKLECVVGSWVWLCAQGVQEGGRRALVVSRKMLSDSKPKGTHSQVLLPKTQLSPHHSSALQPSLPPHQPSINSAFRRAIRVDGGHPCWRSSLGTGTRKVLLCSEMPTSNLDLSTSGHGNGVEPFCPE